MSRRNELYLFMGLLVLLAIVYFLNRHTGMPSIPGVLASDTKFQPLDVQAPQLHLDLLENLRKLEYSGSRRNIFVAAIPTPKTARQAARAPEPFVGPQLPPPPPPLQVPAQFFGYAVEPSTGRRVAFFADGDDVLVVPEGDSLLNRFRLVHIGNESADVEETATGRHATVPLVQGPDKTPNP